MVESSDTLLREEHEERHQEHMVCWRRIGVCWVCGGGGEGVVGMIEPLFTSTIKVYGKIATKPMDMHKKDNVDE